jgi:hypothetical protein
MSIAKNILYYLEEIKIPLGTDYGPEDWKDWYHYVFFSPDHDIRLFINISLSGKKGNGLISGTCAFTRGSKNSPSAKTYAFMKSVAWEKQVIERIPVQIISSDFINLNITETETKICLTHNNRSFLMDVAIQPVATPVIVNELFPYGEGFIGWAFLPGMHATGTLLVNEIAQIIDQDWFCYHDRNYGRFRWGDGSVGWIWWVARLKTEAGSGFAFVFHLGSNKDHSTTGSAYLFVYHDDVLVKTFMSAMVTMELEWTAKPVKHPVLPGSMSTLFSSRKTKIPSKIKIKAQDDIDHVEMVLISESETEIIIPDYQYKQYSFLKEMNGVAEAVINVGKIRDTKAVGCYFSEYVY